MGKIWIDLDNTPHIPFFRPIIEELTMRGFQVKVTARDAYQVCDLADFFHLKYERIGRHYGKSKTMKVIGSLLGALQQVSVMFREKPDLAVSHGSRTQLMAATLLGIPTVMIIDYEYSSPIPLFHPTWLMMPEVMAESDTGTGNGKTHIFKYPGIKEDVYVPSFSPNSSIKKELGISEDSLMVTIRPPATEAHYHCHESDVLFEALIRYLVNKPDIQLVILPRNKKQETVVKNTWPAWIDNKKIIIPDQVVNGLNLIWSSDFVVSGGGTMNRETAALGIPVYSIFCGTIGAVDRYLCDSGRLILLRRAEDFASKILLTRRDKTQSPQYKSNITLQCIVDKITEAAERTK